MWPASSPNTPPPSERANKTCAWDAGAHLPPVTAPVKPARPGWACKDRMGNPRYPRPGVGGFLIDGGRVLLDTWGGSCEPIHDAATALSTRGTPP